jgi:hypothetical protein
MESIRTPHGEGHCRVLLDLILEVVAHNLSCPKVGGDRRHPLVVVAAAVVAAT